MTHPYTQEQAEENIADLRGQVDKMTEIISVNDSAVPSTPASGFSVFSLLGVPQVVGDSGNTGAIPSTQTDLSTNTVTAATTTALSATFTIPANDANVGTCYKLACGGFGVWGSTQQAPTFINILGGTNINTVLFTATDFGASDHFDWDLETYLICATTGSGGTCRVMLKVWLNLNSAGVTAANSFTGVRQGGGITFNTTVNRSFQINFFWNATTGAPTITCNRSVFERIGP